MSADPEKIQDKKIETLVLLCSALLSVIDMYSIELANSDSPVVALEARELRKRIFAQLGSKLKEIP